MTQRGTLNIGGMVQQSIEVISRPSVANFERFERGGTAREAFIYVGLAALVTAVLSAIFHLRSPGAALWTAIGALILTLLGFFVFTFIVNWAGKQFFQGTGTYDEVAYTFALFYAPLALISGVLGQIPLLGWLISLAVLVGYVYFGYLAVQSSMNIRDQGQAIILLVIAAVGYGIIFGLVTAVFAAIAFSGALVSGAFGR